MKKAESKRTKATPDDVFVMSMFAAAGVLEVAKRCNSGSDNEHVFDKLLGEESDRILGAITANDGRVADKLEAVLKCSRSLVAAHIENGE